MKISKSEKLNIEQGTENKTEKKELSLEKIPQEVKNILNKLEEQGYEAYIVGGPVRDLLRGIEPNDWDITTKAKPKEIQEIFPHHFYENKFGTVTVINKTPDSSLRLIEITPFKKEGKYTDTRHPDKVKFADTIEEDIKRRDFTVNAMAAHIKDGKIEIIDLFNGRKDLENKIIRAVGDPEERFQEDALRLIRAPRLAVRLGFDIEKETKKAIQENAGLLSLIGKREVKNEFLKILESKNPTAGIEMLEELKIFPRIFPEIEKEFAGKNLKKENFPLLKKGADTDYSMESRLALFFLDLKNIKDINEIELSKECLRYLKGSNEDIKKISALFHGNKMVNDFRKLDKQTARRLWITFALKNRIDDDVKKTMEDFIFIQKIQGGNKYIQQDIEDKKKMIFEASKDPLFLDDLKLKGGNIIEELKIKPSYRINKILRILLDKVIEYPGKNNREYLMSEAKNLNRLNGIELNFRLLKILTK